MRSLPLTGAVETAGFTVNGRATPAGGPGPSADYAVVAGNHFGAMGILSIAGRAVVRYQHAHPGNRLDRLLLHAALTPRRDGVALRWSSR